MKIISLFYILLFSVTFSSCEKRKDTDYFQLLNDELKDSKLLLSEEIEKQNDFIELKVSDYPFLKPSFKELNNFKTEIKNFKMNSQKQNAERNLSEFIKKVNTNSKMKFEFNSIKKNINDSLYSKILEIDLLKSEYLMNRTFIEKHCNIIE